MAINKTINKRSNTHGAMRNCIEYVLRQDKTSELLTYVTGPYCHDEIKYSIWILLISVSSIAVIGDVVRKYFPINLILLLGLINIAAMEIKIYCHNKRELY